MAALTVRVTCLRCRESRDVEVVNVLFSPVHFLSFALIGCPHCHRLTFHVLGREAGKDGGIKALGGGGR